MIDPFLFSSLHCFHFPPFSHLCLPLSISLSIFLSSLPATTSDHFLPLISLSILKFLFLSLKFLVLVSLSPHSPPNISGNLCSISRALALRSSSRSSFFLLFFSIFTENVCNYSSLSLSLSLSPFDFNCSKFNRHSRAFTELNYELDCFVVVTIVVVLILEFN